MTGLDLGLLNMSENSWYSMGRFFSSRGSFPTETACALCPMESGVSW